MEKSKKIVMVTFTPHLNFGTCLQSFALNTVLKKMGHDVVLYTTTMISLNEILMEELKIS